MKSIPKPQKIVCVGILVYSVESICVLSGCVCVVCVCVCVCVSSTISRTTTTQHQELYELYHLSEYHLLSSTVLLLSKVVGHWQV